MTTLDHTYPTRRLAPHAPARPAWLRMPAAERHATTGAVEREGDDLTILGYILVGLAALFPIMAIPGVIVGIIMATRPANRARSAAVIVLSLVVGVVSFFAWAAINSPGTI